MLPAQPDCTPDETCASCGQPEGHHYDADPEKAQVMLFFLGCTGFKIRQRQLAAIVAPLQQTVRCTRCGLAGHARYACKN